MSVDAAGPLRCLAGAVVLLLAATPVLASRQQIRFEASVSRVRVNVIVTDREGRFIDDLRAEDFRLYEDDEPREITGVQLVDLAAGELTMLDAVDPAGDAGGATPSTVDVPPSAPDASAPAAETIDVAARFGAIVFFIDFIGLDHVTKLHFTNQWERYLRDRETTAVPQAVYMVDQVGVLREIAPLTIDMDVIRAAQQTVEATPLTRYSASDDSINEREGAFREYDRAQYSFRLLGSFADALAARPGRTALVWVSRGLDLKANLHARGFGPNARLLQMQDEFVAAANTGNVSVYGVDPSRLIDLFGGDPSGTRAGGVRDEMGDTLRHAARETGGEAFVAWADFGEVVETIENDSARYYLITYAVADTDRDGEYHTIRVEVDRPEVEVRSTTGYVAHDEEERRSRFVSAALTLPGTVNDLPVAAETILRPLSRSQVQVRVAVTVGGGAVGFQVDDEGRLIQRVEVHGVLLNDDKEVVAEMNRQVTETLEDDDAEPVEELVSRHNWNVEPGSYELRVMVIDDATGRVGTTLREVEVRRRR